MGRRAILLLTMSALAGPASAGSTRCWIDRGAVVAAAAFGDIAGDFIIDVGAPVSRLHVTAAETDGVAGGSATRPLVFAGRRRAAVRMTVADLDALPPADTNIAGVIGADVLSRWPLTIAFQPCRLTWGPMSISPGAVRLPVAVSGGVATVPVEISDGTSARDGAMVVTTGRTETLVPRATLTRTPKPGSFAPVRLRAVVVGGRLLEHVPAGLADGGTGSVGTGVWRAWRSVTLDFRRGWMELTPTSAGDDSPGPPASCRRAGETPADQRVSLNAGWYHTSPIGRGRGAQRSWEREGLRSPVMKRFNFQQPSPSFSLRQKV